MPLILNMVQVCILEFEQKRFEREPIYGLGLGYLHSFNGINNSGFNLGFTIVVGNENDDVGMGSVLQLGYQF
jgi:hypothetical protein